MCAAAVKPDLFEPILRNASESIYERLLDDVQEYLKSNVEYNIASEIDCARRDAADLRAKLAKAQALADALDKIAGCNERPGHVAYLTKAEAAAIAERALAAWEAKP